MLASRFRSRVSAWGLAIGIGLLVPGSALAQDVPFTFLIKDGWKNMYAGATAWKGSDFVSWAGAGTLHAVANGQKGSVMGTGFIQAYSRTVPDPTFAAIKPLAGLVTLDFGTFQGHLALFDTPSGLRTTVAVIGANGITDTRISGNWLLGNGAGIAGGTADDMVVGVLVHFGQPQSLGAIPVVIPPYFPLVNFTNSIPFQRFGPDYFTGPAQCLGSAYGMAQGPLRIYTRCDAYGLGAQFDGALLVMNTGGGNYAVLACSRLFTPPSTPGFIDALVDRCTVSGTGPVLTRLTGGVSSYTVNHLTEAVLSLLVYFAP